MTMSKEELQAKAISKLKLYTRLITPETEAILHIADLTISYKPYRDYRIDGTVKSLLKLIRLSDEEMHELDSYYTCKYPCLGRYRTNVTKTGDKDYILNLINPDGEDCNPVDNKWYIRKQCINQLIRAANSLFNFDRLYKDYRKCDIIINGCVKLNTFDKYTKLLPLAHFYTTEELDAMMIPGSMETIEVKRNHLSKSV